ncbi:hypothetical protein I0E51_04480 [Pseudomonas lalucatii]|nr:hypothetical protein [Pseudomonas lalucatii]
MKSTSKQDPSPRGGADGEHGWPRDFDFREAYAEQRELLSAAPGAAPTSNSANGGEHDE